MNIIELILLSVSLAMDCFSVSVASGCSGCGIRWKLFLKMAFFFGLFQALMPVIGWAAAYGFADLIIDFDHWVAFAMLGFLGVKMIIEGLKDDESKQFDATRLSVMLSLSVATSIDALAVGISFAFTGYNSLQSLLQPVAAIGLASFVLSLAGSIVGSCARRLLKFRMEIVGGIVLIGIGLKILLEHLGVI